MCPAIRCTAAGTGWDEPCAFRSVASWNPSRMGEFSLSPRQGPVRAVFRPLASPAAGSGSAEPNQHPAGQPSRAGPAAGLRPGAAGPTGGILQDIYSLEDTDLKLRVLDRQECLSVETEGYSHRRGTGRPGPQRCRGAGTSHPLPVHLPGQHHPDRRPRDPLFAGDRTRLPILRPAADRTRRRAASGCAEPVGPRGTCRRAPAICWRWNTTSGPNRAGC